MGPVNWLWAMVKISKLSKVAKEPGMGPVKELLESLSSFKAVNWVN
jgi:hypothetical protein